MNPKIKNIIIFSAIALLAVIAYFVFFKKTPQQVVTTSTTPNINTALPASSTQSTSPVVGGEFLSLLLSIKTIKIDEGIFSSPAFSHLNDSSIRLVSEGNEGRINPFAPIGSDGSALQPTEEAATAEIPDQTTASQEEEPPAGMPPQQ